MTVVIIGSGMAGTSAAAKLTEKGVSVVILEAQDRIGGRMYTIQGKHRKYDLGASWIHDTLWNPLFPIANELGIELARDDGLVRNYTSDGLVNPESRVEACASDILVKIGQDLSRGELKAQEFTLQEYASDFVKNWPLVTEIEKVLAPRYVQLLELLYAAPWQELPASLAAHAHSGRNAFLVNGYSQLYQWMYDQIDESKLELYKEAPVTKIKKSGDEFVVVSEKGEFKATHVICTIPQGPLQSSLFDFQLPPPLKTSIDEGKMGALGKFFLEFKEKFWPDDADKLYYLVNQEAMANPSLKPGSSPVMACTTYDRYGGPPTLFFLTSPPLTNYLEANHDKVYEYLKPFLKAIKVKDVGTIEPVQVYGTDWTQNKYFQGSYSTFHKGQSIEGIVEPFIKGDGRLRFAGEHTAIEGSGCVHGAYLSGLRESEYVLKDLGINS